MIVQLKSSKSVQTLIFYAVKENVEKARKAIEEMKPILQKYGFPIEAVSES